MAKGFTQLEGIDYSETFSPMVKITTVILVFIMASSHHYHLQQLNVNNSFLHGDLQEDVYLKVPPGFQVSKPNQVCQLQRSLYRLKQASRQWNFKLNTFLVSLGFIQSKTDYSLLVKHNNSKVTILLIYVDDIVLTEDDLNEIQQVKHLLNQQFKIRDLGDLKFFLGLEVARSAKGIVLSQRKFTLQLLEDAGFLTHKPANTPMTPGLKLSTHTGAPLLEPTQY